MPEETAHTTLVVANLTASTPALLKELERRAAAGGTTFTLLIPPEKHADLFIMQDLLIEHDAQVSLWRYHHVLMVERMLGMKPGTGGSEGVGYLMKTITKRFFPELWEARTHLSLPSPPPPA